ncbi:MAG: hypothetical protein ACFFDF_11250 [Candidatus Odinarchaeota archaeon]
MNDVEFVALELPGRTILTPKEKDMQLTLFGKIVKITEKKKRCPYCKQWLKVIDGRHLSRCQEYIKSISLNEGGKEIRLIDGLEKLTPFKKVEYLDLGENHILPIFQKEGEWFSLRIQFRDALGINPSTMRELYRTLRAEELVPNWHSLTTPRSITRRVLERDFEGVISTDAFPTVRSFVLLRVPDMIILAGRSQSEASNRVLLILAHRYWDNVKWTTELIYKLRKTETEPEKLFMIVCLMRGIILEKIAPQRHYRIAGTITTIRPDFKIWDKYIIEINEEYDSKQHQQARDNPRGRFFLRMGKKYIPFTNREIRFNVFGCVQEFIDILINDGIDFWKKENKALVPEFLDLLRKNKVLKK